MEEKKTINVNQLLGEFSSLRTFQEVEAWDSDAELAIKGLLERIENISNQLPKKRKELEQSNFNHKMLPFFKKLLTPNKIGKSLLSEIQSLEKEHDSLETIIDELQSRIDTTPNSKNEQKSLLKELKHEKKELQAQKREISSNMRAVREHARTKSANANMSVLGLMGKTAAQRRIIRLNKEAALKPHENERDAIERQIALLDKQIRWAERFADDAVEQSNPAERQVAR